MKNCLSIVAVAALFALSACNNDKKENSTEGTTPAAPAVDSAAIKNLAVSHAINKGFETGDFSAIRSMIADDAVDHSGPQGDVKGADAIIASMKEMQASSTGMKTEVVKELADKDYVFEWMKMSGTMSTDAYGMKKGQSFNSQSIEVTKFNSANQATEHWTFMTMEDMMKMMPPPPPPAKK